MFEFATFSRERSIFKGKAHVKPPDQLNQRARTAVRLQCQVGERGMTSGGDLDGTAVSLKMIRVDKVVDFMREQNLPKDAGGVISVDLLLHADAANNDVKQFCFLLKQLILAHIGEELTVR